jgi:hypothetical protein
MDRLSLEPTKPSTRQQLDSRRAETWPREIARSSKQEFNMGPTLSTTQRNPQNPIESMARETGVLSPNNTATGKSNAEVRADQRVSITEEVAKLAGSGLTKAAPKGVEMLLGAGQAATRAGVLFSAAGLGASTYKLLAAYGEAHAEGQALRAGYERDSVRMATAWLGAGALPSGYVQAQEQELRDVAGQSGLLGQGPAAKLVTAIAADPAKFKQATDTVTIQIQQGRDVASKLGIKTDADLARHLQDPAFAAAYSQNLAFQHGVKSVIFEQSVAIAQTQDGPMCTPDGYVGAESPVSHGYVRDESR